MSQPIALVNKPFFKSRLDQKLDADVVERVNVVNTRKGERPIVDSYGRVTYFYARLGNKKIPIYQPGTIMFESGVIPTGELAVEAHGSQQNGAILGNGCAIFLCKFIASLIKQYEELCEGKGHELDSEMCEESYKAALTKVLSHCAVEDMKEHGRLLCMKEVLCDIVSDKKLSDE